jgi:hypothetical protein
MAQQITNSRAIERDLIAAHLRTVAPGATTTYAELSTVAGIDIRAARHVLKAAREEVCNEDGIVFESLINIGLRRLTQSELATVQPDRRRHKAYRQSRIALREMRGVDEAALPPGERTQFLARLAQHGAIAAIATHRATAHLVAAQPDLPNLDLDQTLDLLREIR